MMSWKIRLVTDDGRPPGWPRALLRLAVGAVPAVAGLMSLFAFGGGTAIPRDWGLMLLVPAVANYLWMGFDAEARTLHDKLTGCRVERTG